MAAREGSLLAVSFHAELGSDDRLHRAFLELVQERAQGGQAVWTEGASRA